MASDATEGSDASGDASGGWFGRAVDGPHGQELRDCRVLPRKGVAVVMESEQLACKLYSVL